MARPVWIDGLGVGTEFNDVFPFVCKRHFPNSARFPHGINLKPLAQISLATIDQVVWSLGNFGLSIGLAKSVSSASILGAYSISVGLVLLSCGVIGGYSYEPLVAIPSEQRSNYFASCLKLSALASLVAAIPVVALPIVLGVALPGKATVLVALAVPVMCVTETMRGMLLLSSEQRAVFALDGTWTVITLALTGVVLALRGGPELILAAWIVGASIGSSVCASRLPCLRRARLRGGAFLEVARRIGAAFSAEYVLAAGLAQILPLLIVVASSQAEVGVLRLALVAFGPATTMQAAIYRVSQAIFRDRMDDDVPNTKFAVKLGLVLLCSTLAWALFLAGLGVRGGSWVFGPVWALAFPLLPFATAQQVLVSLTTPAAALTRGRLLIRRSLGLRGLSAALNLTIVPTGAAFYGASGAMVGMVFVNGILLVLFWHAALSS